MLSHDLLLAQAVSAVLLAWWKMLLIVLPFVGWAWLVATKLDKDARYFHLNFHAWNGVHLACGFAALCAALLIPIFWIGWPVQILLLAAPILAYWKLRNAAVPEGSEFHLSGQSLSDRMTARRQARASQQALLQFANADNKPLDVPLKDDPLFAVHMVAEDLLGPAIAARAARVEVTVGPSGAVVNQSIDGIRYKREPIATEAAIRMIDYLKGIAGLDVNDRRRRQQGEFKLRGPNGATDVTMVVKGSSSGQVAQIDFDRSKRLHKPFDGLGLLNPQLQSLRAFEPSHERHGIILIGAPPGQGLTTSAYAFLGRHDAYTSNIKALEREIAVRLEGVDQVQWDPANPDVDYATNLQSILRRDPDVVLVSDVRDNETAKVASDPGMQGPLIYIQQPLPTIVDQIRDWVKRVGDVKQATRALRAATNQRLMRSLCPNCRQPYTPTPEQIKKLNLPAKKVTQLFRAGGKVQVKNKIEDCPICSGTGYLGQTAAFEVFIVDDEGRRLLAAGDLKAALAHARRNSMIYLQEAALAKVIAGETTLDEIVRVTTPSAPVAGAVPPPREQGDKGSAAA
jgi:type II secretory ATPase GspE/PulE/Tfp pilus assembly ATPase PilB-like protein